MPRRWRGPAIPRPRAASSRPRSPPRGSRYVREDYVAAAYLALGDTARTLEWLERGLDAQAANMAQINRAWRFKPLHGNPGFAAIVRKAGLKLWP